MPKLKLIPTFDLGVDENDNVFMEARSLSGLDAYADLWPGLVSVHFNAKRPKIGAETSRYIDTEHRFELSTGDCDWKQSLSGYDVVLCGLDAKHLPIMAAAKSLGIPCVAISEYSWRTRQEQLWIEAPSLLRAIKRSISNLICEFKFRSVVKKSLKGVQCNGYPTYKAYKEINSNALLFFDSRILDGSIIQKTAIADRYAPFNGSRLRLVYSGRLCAIKGVQDLPCVISELVRLGINPHLDIFGDGPLKGAMIEKASRLGVLPNLTFHGYRDHQKEIVPWVSSNVDAFLCCHHQGDPSMTYLDMMAAGLPIFGYANESLDYFAERVGTARTVKRKSPSELARLIFQTVSTSPSWLMNSAVASAVFCQDHTFSVTIKRRIAQLIGLAEGKG